jgi:hypothetical protein
MNQDSSSERRNLPDRRRKPTTIWGSIIFGGRRRHVRRESERGQPHYVDHFPWTTFIWILLLVLFTFIDGILTLELLDAGCVEANPLLHFSLGKGPEYFLIVKYLLTVTGLPLLVFFGARNRMRFIFPGFVLLYIVLIVYQLLLLRQLSVHV